MGRKKVSFGGLTEIPLVANGPQKAVTNTHEWSLLIGLYLPGWGMGLPDSAGWVATIDGISVYRYIG